jgi:hypothetical protein
MPRYRDDMPTIGRKCKVVRVADGRTLRNVKLFIDKEEQNAPKWRGQQQASFLVAADDHWEYEK